MIKAIVVRSAMLFSLFSASAARADDHSRSTAGQMPERISFLVTFGEEKCPATSAPDEIIVCATAPEGDRYRIPKDLRAGEDEPAEVQSWPSAVATLEDAARPMRPNSCSVVGSGGFTGCTQALLRQWFAARRAMSDAD
jgi:hypothetical protein